VVLKRALGVGAQVLESVFGRVLGLFGAAGDALVVGVVGGRAGLGAGLALGLGGLAALVGGGHFCVVLGWVVWEGLGCWRGEGVSLVLRFVVVVGGFGVGEEVYGLRVWRWGEGERSC
jgi:hypothetical protein